MGRRVADRRFWRYGIMSSAAGPRTVLLRWSHKVHVWVVMPRRTNHYATQIAQLTSDRINLVKNAGDVWRFAASLKSISEDTAQEYAGRTLLELIQNGHDAIGAGRSGRIHILLDLTDGVNALYVANDGAPFTLGNFRALVEFALSDKAAGEGIGNKGLGFRSVMGLTDVPEIYSCDPNDPDDHNFSGYSLRFPAVRELATLTDDNELSHRLQDEVSPLALPLPIFDADANILAYGSSRFATVVKLPLRDTVAQEEAKRQVAALSDPRAPILLFLDRISEVDVTVRLSPSEEQHSVLIRTEQPSPLLPATQPSWVCEVDLGSQGRYLVARRPTAETALREVLIKSVAARQIDASWLDWAGNGWVGVALRLDVTLQAGSMYTFLPMSQASPLPAHVHAPFFTKLARRDVTLAVFLNEYLMGEIANTCVALGRLLRTEGDHDAVAPHVVDLCLWQPTQRKFLEDAFNASGSSLGTESFIPLASTARWATIVDAYVCPAALESLSVISERRLADLGCPVIDPTIGRQRKQILRQVRMALDRGSLDPSPDVLASWSETVAAALLTEKASFDVWGTFYDDLSVVFTRYNAHALSGRRIILDQNSSLQVAMNQDRDGPDGQILCFPPKVDEGGTFVDSRLSLPVLVSQRVLYVQPGITWQHHVHHGRMRPGRDFLEDNHLVLPYEPERFVDVLRTLTLDTGDSTSCKEILRFASSLYHSVTPEIRTRFAGAQLLLPTREGEWTRADSLFFGGGWEIAGGELLDDLIGQATDATPQFGSLSHEMVANSCDWTFPVDDVKEYGSFLKTLGVKEGLPLRSVKLPDLTAEQIDFEQLAEAMVLTGSLRDAWIQDAEKAWVGKGLAGALYHFSQGLSCLPLTDEIEFLGPRARATYAQLVVMCLTNWKETVFEVSLLPEQRAAAHCALPTPLMSYLVRIPWLPSREENPVEVPTFALPTDLWIAKEGKLPRFMPGMAEPIVKLAKGTQAAAGMARLGVHDWDSPETAGLRLIALQRAFDARDVGSDEMAAFRKHCSDAWEDIVQDDSLWPWTGDELPIVMVSRATEVQSCRLESGTGVLIPDETNLTKTALFGVMSHPLLIVDPIHGRAVADLWRSRGYQALVTSEVTTEVYADGDIVRSTGTLPLLMSGDRMWLASLIAVVAEIRHSNLPGFPRHQLADLADLLQTIRVLRAGSVRLQMAGEWVEVPENVASIAIDDDVAPSIVVWGEDTTWGELGRCSKSLAHLIGLPYLADTLQLVFLRLDTHYKGAFPSRVEDSVLATVLDADRTSVVEALGSLRGYMLQWVDGLRIVTAYFLQGELPETLEHGFRSASDDQQVVMAITPYADNFPLPLGEILTLCRTNIGLVNLRDALHLDFVRFNKALVDEFPSWPPIRHPEIHQEAMQQFITLHRTAILNRLREAYLPTALSRGELSQYLVARSLTDLEPDPEWLDLYIEPPENLIELRVTQWLVAHDANPDLSLPAQLPDVEDLRRRNAEQLILLVGRAASCVREWDAGHPGALSISWLAPQAMSEEALDGTPLADFLELSEHDLLGVIAEAVGWPDGMPLSVDPVELQLSGQFRLPDQDESNTVSLRRESGSNDSGVSVGLKSLMQEDDQTTLNLVTASVTEEFLAQSGGARVASNAGFGRGNHVVRNRRPGGRFSSNEKERRSIGLAGEIVAGAWLQRHYTDVEWVSGYGGTSEGGTPGDDGLGYDFRAKDGSLRQLYFEVKAVAAALEERANFYFGETEFAAAEKFGDAYRLLFISAVLQPQRRRIFELPSPLSVEAKEKYVVLSRRVHYSCHLESSG